MSQLVNPVTTAIVGAKAANKTSDFISNNGKGILITLATVGAIYYVPKQWKKWRAERYARANIGKPHVTAAAIIHESFAKVGFKSGLFSYLLPEFNIYTDEAALMNIASRISNIQLVAKAYKILFDADLFKDTTNGLSTSELNTFYNAIGAATHNDDPQLENSYLIGDLLYCAKKPSIRVPQVTQQEDGAWITTEKLYGNFTHKDLIGQVIALGIYEPENKRYYIVKSCAFLGFWCDYGIVWADQVTNEEF